MDKKEALKWQNLYDALLKKCLKNNKDDDAEYTLDSIPEDVLPLKHYSNCVKTSTLSSKQKKLVEKFEVTLKSCLHEMALKREKAKILCLEDLKSVDLAFKGELRRLYGSVGLEELDEYIKLCLIPDQEIIDLIENKIQSNLKECLVREAGLKVNTVEFRKWLIKTLREWHLLLQAVQEDELVVYALHVLKNAGF
ncbi:uncharacterized protein LOC123005635 isoform X2 [Tribolium madens]|nr:uncharacterized protein LOC123005635 isoform X2 [Tribolium madens]